MAKSLHSKFWGN